MANSVPKSTLVLIIMGLFGLLFSTTLLARQVAEAADKEYRTEAIYPVEESKYYGRLPTPRGYGPGQGYLPYPQPSPRGYYPPPYGGYGGYGRGGYGGYGRGGYYPAQELEAQETVDTEEVNPDYYRASYGRGYGGGNHRGGYGYGHRGGYKGYHPPQDKETKN